MFQTWKTTSRSAALFLAVFTLLTGLLYPLAVTAASHLLFPRQSAGSIILRHGKPAGSQLIGQPFQSPKYFWSRPSATSPSPYNASSSAGSNLGPNNPALLDAVKARLSRLRASDPSLQRVPLDLVTASASGLDPHLTPDSADAQVPRVAKARRLPESLVRDLVRHHIEQPQFGLLGNPRVNVLGLNLSLDELAAKGDNTAK